MVIVVPEQLVDLLPQAGPVTSAYILDMQQKAQNTFLENGQKCWESKNKSAGSDVYELI